MTDRRWKQQIVRDECDEGKGNKENTSCPLIPSTRKINLLFGVMASREGYDHF